MKLTKLSRAKLIIDWHNYGYSILRVNHVNKVLVFLGKIYEMRLGKYGDYHLCVSKAMQVDLQYKFGIRDAKVMYDKATAKFGKAIQMSLKERH